MKASPGEIARWVVAMAAALAVVIGGWWLAAWMGGFAAQWSAGPSITMKTNMALGLVLAGSALLLLGWLPQSKVRRGVGVAAAGMVLLIGSLTLSEHLIGWNLGIDQLLAQEAPGAIATASPNRVGIPGSSGLTLLGIGLLLLSTAPRGEDGRRASCGQRMIPYLGLAVIVINLIPAVGFLYRVDEFFDLPATGIAAPTVIAMLALGLGLALACPQSRPIALLLGDDAGGGLLRRMLPAALLLPLGLGFLRVFGQTQGLYDTAMGTGLLVLSLMLVFSLMLWRSAGRLSGADEQQKQGEVALRESDLRYRTLFNNKLNGMCYCRIVLDENGRPVDYQFLEVNDVFSAMTGLQKEAVLGRAASEVMPGIRQSAFDFVGVHGKVALDGEEATFETYQEGLQRWYSVFVFSPRKEHFVSIFTDITERKRADEALRKSEERLRLVLEATSIGTFEIDLLTGEARWNPTQFELLGLKPGDEQPSPEMFFRFVHPEDIGPLRAQWEQATRTGALDTEFRIVREDGQERWLAGKGRFAFEGSTGGDGAAAGRRALRFMGVNFDITDRKRAEEKAAAAHRQVQGIIDNTTSIIYALDLEERFIRANAALAEILGTTPEQMVGKRRHELMPKEDADWHEANDRQVIEAGRALEFEEYSQLQGRSITWLTTKFPLRDAQGKIYAVGGISADVSDRKKAEEDLRAAKLSAEKDQVAAEQASKAKDHFLAVLSHELRTPLTPVLPALGALEALVLPEGREYLEICRRNVELEARLIDDLLDVTRITRGRISLDRRPVELCTVIQHAAVVCQPDIIARRLHFGVKVHNGPHIVNADIARLQQVFWNLIKNAVKFTPQGGCVGVQCYRKDDGRVLVEVSDSGEGIEAEALGRIFNAFEQEGRSTSRQFGGLGLGLAISKAMVELHGGRIEARSDGRGKGATFTVELPLHKAEMTTEPRPGVSSQLRGTPRGLSILLVEDHGDTARVLSRLLTAAGHTVKHAGAVATAIEMTKREDFDLLLSDLGLPDGSGQDLMRQLVAAGKRLPAIALSGYGMAADAQSSRDAGFVEHITKPVQFDMLKEAIARVVGSPAERPTAIA